jgi:hypothetical protein
MYECEFVGSNVDWVVSVSFYIKVVKLSELRKDNCVGAWGF